MWRLDGTKLTGWYGTWKGAEFELLSMNPDGGLLTLVQDGGAAPGSAWHTQILPNRFARTPSRHTLYVPADEVTGINSVNVTGFIDPDCELVIIAEVPNGNLAAECSIRARMSGKMKLIDIYGFSKRDEGPLGRTSLFGYIPEAELTDISSRISYE
ncbi:hypothetical protein [Arthrobacter sp.]|uniref:hypothetical protein n=1 Tax=Arthrobacter sp. TaxID=1667 RepID=UPI00289E6725|nr:hypothetical protein [Arthrobacter sp.]